MLAGRSTRGKNGFGRTITNDTPTLPVLLRVAEPTVVLVASRTEAGQPIRRPGNFDIAALFGLS